MTEPASPDAVSTVSARLTPTFGRFVVSARTNHLVSDGRASLGAPGEAIAAGELMLASLASCGLGLVQIRASELGADLRDAQVEVAFERDPDDATRFRSLTLRFRLVGPIRSQAEEAIAFFTGKCPIYNTLKRGGPIETVLLDGDDRELGIAA